MLLPLLGMAFNDTLPEPDSAFMPLVSSCISAMLPLSVTYPTPDAAPMSTWLRKLSNIARVPVLP